MPIFQFNCPNCKKEKEIITIKISESNSPTICECGSIMNKKVSNTNFYLKGNGWYKNGFNGSGE